MGKGKTGSESEFEEEKRSGDGPVDVSSVPDRTSRVLNSDVDPVLTESSSANVLDLYGRGAEVGSHSEVWSKRNETKVELMFENSPCLLKRCAKLTGNGGSEADSSGELVESSLTDGSLEGHSEETHGGNEHDSEDGP